MMSEGDRDIVLLYAPRQNAFYKGFARRLFLACCEVDPTVRLISAGALSELDDKEIENASALIINPQDNIVGVEDRATFLRKLSKFKSRTMFLAEALETDWFSSQLKLPIKLDRFVDVGFVSQAGKLERLGFSGVPYEFMFNGLLPQEVGRLRARNSEDSPERDIPWAFIGHKTIERVELARWLSTNVDAGGVLFLPDQGRGVRPGSGAIGPQGMDMILGRTRYYVWMAHHNYPYYESFRYREAVVNGAVPVKLDGKFSSEFPSVPGIVPERGELERTLTARNYEQAFEASHNFYLENPSLEEEARRVVFNEL